MLASQLCCGELKRSRLHVTQEVVRAEDRVVLRVDRGHPASNLCNHAKRNAKVLSTKVLQGRSGAIGARVFGVEEDIPSLAIDAGSQNVIVLAQLGVDPADNLFPPWVKHALLWLLHEVLNSLIVKAHSAQLIKRILWNLLGVGVDGHPEVWVWSFQCKAIYGLRNAVLFCQRDGIIASGDYVTDDVHNIAL